MLRDEVSDTETASEAPTTAGRVRRRLREEDDTYPCVIVRAGKTRVIDYDTLKEIADRVYN